ncbi:hypothetical protein [Bdellovibrio sp. HCB337]|uniref:hypothetical protein n=1 Tax=Bdellovibrio sp. HCB337 TaxID=3394358 RepID=UPI0039A739B0
MKKLFLVVLFSPLISFAGNTGNYLLSVNIEQPFVSALTCGRFSDADCFGRAIDSVCIKDPQRGKTGVCRQVSIIYEDETVTCRCF